MTDDLLTEDQEAERAKQWVRENGLFIVAGVVLGLGGLFGWQQWEDAQMARAESASNVWEQLRGAIEGQRFNEVEETLALLESDYSGTPYLDQARLALAASHMRRNDPDAALAELDELVASGSDAQLQRVGELRRAQILNSLERYDDALATLGEEEAGGLVALFHELRGDALFGKGEFDDARLAYQASLNTDVGGVIDRSFVQMKLDQAAAAVGTAAVEPVAEEVTE